MRIIIIVLIQFIFLLCACNNIHKKDTSSCIKRKEPFTLGIKNLNENILKDSSGFYIGKFNSFIDTLESFIQKDNNQCIKLNVDFKKNLYFDFYFQNKFKNIKVQDSIQIYSAYLYSMDSIHLFLVLNKSSMGKNPDIISMYGEDSDYYYTRIDLVSTNENFQPIENLIIYSTAELTGTLPPYSTHYSYNRFNRFFYLEENKIFLLSFYEELWSDFFIGKLIEKETYQITPQGTFQKL